MIRDLSIDVSPADAGPRLDRFLADRFPSTSRSLVARAIEQNAILVNDRPAAKGRRLAAGDRVRVVELLEQADWKAAPNPALPLAVIHEDPAFLVLDKPAGLPVHPLEPGDTRTVVSALIARHPELSAIGPDPLFPAIAHRLDTDTSGLLLAARDESAYRSFRRQFQAGDVDKRYIALVGGAIGTGGRLDQLLAHAGGGAHRMVVVPDGARGRRPMRAITEYEPREALPGFTRLDVRIRTGVTHQIRCQLASLGHPVAGDALYGSASPGIPRLFLHAAEIAFRHPRAGTECRFHSPLPADLRAALESLRSRGSSTLHEKVPGGRSSRDAALSWIDAHCHLQDDRLAPDLDGVLARARAAGVERMVCCGSAESDWNRVVELAGRHPDIIPAFGLHPWYLRERSAEWLPRLERLLIEHPRAGVGEIGLDHALPDRNDAEQEEVFLAQLHLARRLGRPVWIHSRRAWGRMPELLRQFGRHEPGLVLHSYSGPAELMEKLAALNAYFSFSGTITRSNNRRGREAAARAPADRLLIETDAPDLPPVIRTPDGSAFVPPLNEPAHLVHVAAALAELRGWTLEETARVTGKNADRILQSLNP
ncbi:MAG TPA: TatD family hydrolase [Kiritimatiellia bacterium]|nr:TatD family hydrolase [Kiritimatiellia bacterium]HRZ13804.1 TatD family hydrolase [Kiritimatiellia bacterium]HSA19425.1 TatD family hydrolase [Kiritimatiellia bacterium]